MEKFKFTSDAIEQAKSCADFYEAVGLYAIMNSDRVDNVAQVWMNAGECEELLSACKRNLKKSKDYQYINELHIDNMAGMDWLAYSPVSSPDVPAGELWLYEKDEYMNALGLMRQRSRDLRMRGE